MLFKHIEGMRKHMMTKKVFAINRIEMFFMVI